MLTKKKNIILFVGIIIASIIGTKSFANTYKSVNPEKPTISTEEINRIFKTIKDNPEFSMFYSAISKAELSKEISKLERMTLMIPTNKAFKLLPEDVWGNFMEEDNIDALVELLNYHVIPRKVKLKELKSVERLSTIQDQSITIYHKDKVKVENATIQEKHEETDDIIIYKIDRLIMPLL
jgi:uncharacterized surface protein with fasciclin (FAS1) repeats